MQPFSFGYKDKKSQMFSINFVVRCFRSKNAYNLLLNVFHSQFQAKLWLIWLHFVLMPPSDRIRNYFLLQNYFVNNALLDYIESNWIQMNTIQNAQNISTQFQKIVLLMNSFILSRYIIFVSADFEAKTFADFSKVWPLLISAPNWPKW